MTHIDNSLPIPTNHVMEIIAAVFVSFGLSGDPRSILAGLFMAIAGSLIAVRWRSDEKSEGRKAFWVVVLTGLFVAIFGVLISQGDWAQSYISGVPIQAIMGGLGFSSSYIVRVTLRMGRRFEQRTEDWTDKKLGLPSKSKDDK